MAAIYITRYALTAGIQKVDATLHDDGTTASYKVEGHWITAYVHGKDFWLTEGDAKKRANEMVAKKIASVEKQLVKLRKLTF